MSERFQKPYEVQECHSAEKMQSALNDYAAQNYGLHSWHAVSPGADCPVWYTCVFAKLQNVPEKPQGIRAR